MIATTTFAITLPTSGSPQDYEAAIHAAISQRLLAADSTSAHALSNLLSLIRIPSHSVYQEGHLTLVFGKMS